MSWNDAKRLTTVTNNAGETIEYGYNANGDVTSTVVKSTSATVVKQQSALFDELGRLMRSTGASSQQTSYGSVATSNNINSALITCNMP